MNKLTIGRFSTERRAKLYRDYVEEKIKNSTKDNIHHANCEIRVAKKISVEYTVEVVYLDDPEDY